MTTPHLNAADGAYAPAVLLPGDPLRAQWIAETFLSDVTRVNDVRNMFGFTGTYKGQPVSVQGTGMGMPSCTIYCHELINEYAVKRLIRVGTCGALRADLGMRAVILGNAASTNSAMNHHWFDGRDFAPAADFQLLRTAYDVAQGRNSQVHVGGIVSNDTFYDRDGVDCFKHFIAHGVLAVEMEASAIYTLAARFGVAALAICSVSDNLITQEEISSDQRQAGLTEMVEIALETAIS